MIPAIGLMLASYIFARLLALVNQPSSAYHSQKGMVAVIIFSILSMVCTIVVSLELLFGSASSNVTP
jgi:hypothetical protein